MSSDVDSSSERETSDDRRGGSCSALIHRLWKEVDRGESMALPAQDVLTEDTSLNSLPPTTIVLFLMSLSERKCVRLFPFWTDFWKLFSDLFRHLVLQRCLLHHPPERITSFAEGHEFPVGVGLDRNDCGAVKFSPHNNTITVNEDVFNSSSGGECNSSDQE